MVTLEYLPLHEFIVRLNISSYRLSSLLHCIYKSYQNQEKNRFHDWTITNMTVQAVFTIVHVLQFFFLVAVIFFSFFFFFFRKEVNTSSFRQISRLDVLINNDENLHTHLPHHFLVKLYLHIFISLSTYTYMFIYIQITTK